MHCHRKPFGVAILIGLLAALLTSGARGAEPKPPAKPYSKETPAKAEPPRDHRPRMPHEPGFLPPGMPPHAGLPHFLQALQGAGKAAVASGIGKPAVNVGADLLSGNCPKLLSELAAQLLSGNRAKLLSEINPALLSGNKPHVLSGNETELLSGNKIELFSGNHISILSNLKIEIHISESGNQSHNHAPPPPGKVPPGMSHAGLPDFLKALQEVGKAAASGGIGNPPPPRKLPPKEPVRKEPPKEPGRRR